MIRNFLDLSTAHLSPVTRAWLNEQGVIAAARRDDADSMILLGSTPHGWFVYADTEACRDPDLMARLLARRNVLNGSFGENRWKDGALRDAILDLDRNLAGLVTEPSADIPADLWACFARANAERCDYILFDADAEIITGLPTFEDAAEQLARVEIPLGASA